MGVYLRLDYPHFPDLRPRYLTNTQVEDLAWQVRHQLGYAYPWTPKIPLDLLFNIEGAVVNGFRVTFLWEIEDAIHDEHGVPVLGVCDCDPDEMPDTIMLSANASIVASMVAGIEELLRSILAHELGHGICDGPGWLLAYRNLMLSGAARTAPGLKQMRSVTLDQAHLFSARPSSREFAEFRASTFMGSFLVPRPLILDRLGYHARALGVPLIEAPVQWPSPSGAVTAGFRIAPQSGRGSHFWLRPLFRALAPEFGVTPRFIQVRLMCYGLLDREEVRRGRGARYP
jgi:hypothetical protein